MRKILIALTGIALCAAPALAGPKDQTKDTLIGPQGLAGNATVNNATTAFKMKIKGCKLQLQAKDLGGVADGDIIICAAGADVYADAFPLGAGNAIIFTGEVKAGGLKIKVPLTEIGCGSSNNVQFNGTVSCYLDDPAYRVIDDAPPYPVGSWQEDCDTNFVAPVAPAGNCNPATPELECETNKVNDTVPIILGLCQGITAASLGSQLAGPSSALIAVRGSRGFPE